MPTKNTLKVKRLTKSAKLPTKNLDTDAGIDFFADEDKFLYAGESKLVATGVAIAIPKGYRLILKDRSGLSSKTGLYIHAGVIDEEYRGEVYILFHNSSNNGVEILKGDKIAQGLLEENPTVEIQEVEELDNTLRGDKGFGSSGK